MNNESPSTCLILDESANFGDLYEAISERLVKAQAIMSAITNDAHWETMNDTVQSNVLWAISSLIDEAYAMHGLIHTKY